MSVMFLLFSRSIFVQLTASDKPAKSAFVRSLFSKLIDFKKGIDSANKLNDKYKILNHMYDGVNTPLNDIKTLRDWYKGVRHEYGIGFDENDDINKFVAKLTGSNKGKRRYAEATDYADRVAAVFKSFKNGGVIKA